MIRLLLLSFVVVVAFTAYLLLFLPPDWAIAISVLLALLILWLAGERRG